MFYARAGSFPWVKKQTPELTHDGKLTLAAFVAGNWEWSSTSRIMEPRAVARTSSAISRGVRPCGRVAHFRRARDHIGHAGEAGLEDVADELRDVFVAPRFGEEIDDEGGNEFAARHRNNAR